jgi:hypothetical protein
MESKEEITRRMRDHIRWICDRVGPRPPCSDAEGKCAEYIRNEWAKHTDWAGLEDFTCHPGAYPATFRWPIALFLLALCLYPLVPLLSFACSSGSVLILLFNLILNRELIDRAFPEKTSSNVIAKFEPTGPSDRLVILSCHHDSNFAFPIVNRFGSGFGIFMTVVVLSSALLAVLTFLRVLFPLTGPEAVAAGYERVALYFLVLLAATVPFQLYTFLRVLSDEPVLGANDNLSGVANCLLLGEHLSRPEARPRRTTVWLVSFGCEECGIRGSKRFIERHQDDIRDAYVLNLDMVGGKGTRLRVVTREERNLIRLSPAMIQLVEEAAGEAGIPLQKGPIIAFTDATAFAVKGIQATTLTALDEKGMVDTYHSLEDRPEHLDDNLLFDSYRLCLAFLNHIDARSSSPSPHVAASCPAWLREIDPS